MSRQPLVSILIPTYNRPHYFHQALQSALHQTYCNIEIIVCDDSSDHRTADLIAPYLAQHPQIKYVKNERQLGEQNWNRCMQLSQGEFINFLMDDDLFHLRKIESMMPFMLNDPKIYWVTSYRQMIDGNGVPLPDNPANARLYPETRVLDGQELASTALSRCQNVIGEPSTVLFRRKSLTGPFGNFNGNQYHGLNDLATWVSLSRGKAVYIPEALSFFRVHPEQNQTKIEYLTSAIYEWLILLRDAMHTGVFKRVNDVRNGFLNHQSMSAGLIEIAASRNRHDLLEKNKARDVVAYLDEVLSYSCSLCGSKFKQFVPWPDLYDFPKVIWEMWNKQTAVCPACGAMDRERMYKLFIERETDLLKNSGEPRKLLNVSPERALRNWLASVPNLQQVPADIAPGPGLRRIDFRRLPFPDNYFDILLASHVLQRAADDCQAMRELHRVLKPEGWGIVQVPVALNLHETYEDPSVKSPAARKKMFGQSDHRRIYAKDYVDRLKNSGFFVHEFRFAQRYGLAETMKFGFSEKDVLYVVSRKRKWR
ncbi:glycosyltransferase [Ferviditalea candida]|uniref:Glycosyltransferase n=1 Tax=Ferviditalea candida TaxID=3108399 RepID=A0ABU5ZDW0_9BACL|nr:glycosyltransferase [Paenibacillaceae bacterium T2]